MEFKHQLRDLQGSGENRSQLCVWLVTTQAAGTPSQVRTKFAKPWKWCGGLNIVRMGKISTNKFSRARDENGKDREDPPLSGGIGG